MVAPLPVTATSRSVALQLQPDSVLQAGSLLNLTSSPEASATARTVQGTDPTGALATARGIGAGYSRYYAGLLDEAFFQSPNLSIHSGGGSISGDALATAFSTGRGETDATAQATNIGLANVSYLDRYGGALRIGSTAAPFSAKAVAGTGSVLGVVPGSRSTLTATAVVRGLEGSGSPSSTPLRSGTSLSGSSLTALRRDQPLGSAISFGPGGEPLLDLSGSGGLASADLLLFRDSSRSGSISFYRVLDAAGTVRAADGSLLKPADAGYAAAALAPANRVSELSNLDLADPNAFTLRADQLIDESGLLAPIYTSIPAAGGSPENRFIFAAANPPGTTPLLPFSSGSGAPPFTSAQLGSAQQSPAAAAATLRSNAAAAPYLDLSSSAGLLSVELELGREADYSNQLGFFRILDGDGAVRRPDGAILRPGDPDYISTALSAANRVSELQGLSVDQGSSGSSSVRLIDETGLLAPFVRSTRLDGSSTLLFAYPQLNADGEPHLRLSADGATLLLEDLDLPSSLPGEPDFNDLTARFSSGRAIALPLLNFSASDRPSLLQLSLAPASNGDTIGFYRIADASGAVRTSAGALVYPGDPAYRTAALDPANRVAALDQSGFGLADERGLLAPFLQLAAPDPAGIQERFAFPSANPDGTTPFSVSGLNRFAAGTRQVVVDLLRQLPPAAFGDGERFVAFEDLQARPLPLLDFRGADGPYRTELSLSQPAGEPDRTYGFYRVLDVNGSVRALDGTLLRPGDAGYQSAALDPGNLVSELANLRVPAGQSSVAIPVEIDETGLLAPYAVSGSGPSRLTLFPWPSANPAGEAFPQSFPIGTIAAVAATSPRPERFFYGQPNAVVRADAELASAEADAVLNGRAEADAAAIDGYNVKAVPFGNGDSTASITGTAIASVASRLSPVAANDSLRFNGRAVGIDNSRLYGAPTLNTTIEGIGLALADTLPATAQLERLQGIGILHSRIDSNQGNDVVRAFGGMSDGGLPIPAGLSPTSRDAAGFDGSSITTGLGNDTVFGRILNEIEAGVDHDGDGELEEGVYLDRAALSDPARSGFDGIRHSAVNTGIGNDFIGGSSSVSHLNAEIGNDTINLDRARYSSIWGGIGNDVLTSSGPALHNVFWGGLGNDLLSVSSGDGNLLDGGLGQDVVSGGAGVDHFVMSDAAGALRAVSGTSLRDDLADTPLWATLSEQQKTTLWETGQLLNTSGQLLGRADAFRNFEAGSGGDVLHLSDTLAAVTQELWQQKGAIFGVGPDGKLTVTEASADGSNRIGLVVGTLADIQKLGIGSPTLAYATDTRQMMYDADGLWASGAQSLGSLSISNGASLSRSNLQFGSASGAAAGPAPSGQQEVV